MAPGGGTRDTTPGGIVSDGRSGPRDPEPGDDERRDEELEETFPGSDPPGEGGPGI